MQPVRTTTINHNMKFSLVVVKVLFLKSFEKYLKKEKKKSNILDAVRLNLSSLYTQVSASVTVLSIWSIFDEERKR